MNTLLCLQKFLHLLVLVCALSSTYLRNHKFSSTTSCMWPNSKEMLKDLHIFSELMRWDFDMTFDMVIHLSFCFTTNWYTITAFIALIWLRSDLYYEMENLDN